jgi:HEPN domain-containing protein
MPAQKVDAMTEFTKTKMHFALAFLGTLFALHPLIDKFGDTVGFDYLNVFLKLYYVYYLIACLLGLTVYFYALAMLSERAYSWMEKCGNYSYALAVMVLPLYGALYVSSLAAELLGEAHIAWLGPTVVPLGLGVLWLLVSQILAWRLRKRLGDKDRKIKVEQLAEHEISALNHASTLFGENHYDLAVIEAWKAIEARLRRVLILHGLPDRFDDPDAMIHAATRKGIVTKPTRALLEELRRQWNVAVGFEPLTREAAAAALTAARNILSTIPVEDTTTRPRPAI